ncbi:hypothetical protein ACG83_27765 [Frankia sp. R43]|nr:hypothetical protein ACG83_27765 [Frankia sp. R43]MBE3204682.1 DUF397 domain-containing protein [Parafrankia sp. CH37]
MEWRRPSHPAHPASDVLEVAVDGTRVLIRSGLGPALRSSPAALANFVQAAKDGDFDDLLPTAP